MTAPALASEPLLAKSRVYIHRALGRKDENDLDEYQLWASLALELLGKSALAQLHPCLVADPMHADSLFAAAGKIISTDVKTITAKTLFLRLGHLSPRFDKTVADFCNAIAQRRNTELHSGDVPFRTMKLDAWEERFWHASEVILSIRGETLATWIGADQASAPQAILNHARIALKAAVKLRIETARATFHERKAGDRKSALEEAAGKSWFHHADLFEFAGDAVWETECPACEGKAFSTGEQLSEEVVEQDDQYSAWESVERTYGAEEFHCPVCHLQLHGYAEMAAADLGDEHTEVEEREMEYEPDYGND